MSLSPRLQIVARIRARGEVYRTQRAYRAAWARAFIPPLCLCIPAAIAVCGAAWMRSESHRINQQIAHPIQESK